MSSSAVNFFYQEIRFPFANRNALKSAIVSLFRHEGHRLANLNIVFCTDEALLQINRDFLQHDYYTDIITFPMNSTKASIEAELYISVDRVRDNARQGAVSFNVELHRVIFHGALHLCGYKDKRQEDHSE